MSESLKQTPLHELHVKHGAKMVPFAGYEMPVQYTGIKEEHHAVRNAAGLFDVSHMGEAELRGTDAGKALDHLMTNDISKLKNGRALYTMMCDENGGIVDDLIVYRITEDHYLVCLNASNREKDIAHMQAHLIDGDVQLRDTSDQWAQLALQGPRAEAILSKLTESDLSKIKRFSIEGTVLKTATGTALCMIARTGYTGEDGFEIYIPKKSAGAVFEAIVEKGAEDGMLLAGLGCRDTLRLEAKYMLYGNDIDDKHTPFEAGLAWTVKLKKESDFVGKRALQDSLDKKKENLCGFILEGRGVLRSGYELTHEGKVVGHLTSGTYSPSLEKSIGLGYVDAALPEDAEISVLIRGKEMPLRRVSRPFLEEKEA